MSSTDTKPKKKEKKLTKWEIAQRDYKNQPVYHKTLMNKDNYWTLN